MGNSQSSEINTFIESCMNVTMNILNENISNNTISCVAMNNMNVTVGSTGSLIVDGNFDINQKANVTLCDMSTSINNNSNNEFTTQLKNEIDNLISQSQKSTNGFLALGFSDQESKQNFRAKISTAIDTTMRNSNISTCALSASAINNNTIKIDGLIHISKDYTIDQNAIVNASAKCLVDNIIKNIDQKTIESVVSSAQTSNQVSENRGVFESLGSFMQSMILPLIIVCVIVMVLGGAYTMFKKKGNS